jgi:D-tyrosyl-tRNA(Tyr) deacylase
LLVLLGVHRSDDERQANYIAEKIAGLRIFSDSYGQMNENVEEAHGEVLVVSQFTLYGDTRRGRRPSFVEAAGPDLAEPLVRGVIDRLTGLGIPTSSGVFGAHMDVELINDGPVTILLDSAML